jgi:hypothetical protein
MRTATLLCAAALVASATLFLPAPRACADTLELKDGRIVEGMLIPDRPSEKDGGYYVVSRFGPTFIKSGDIRTRTEAKPVDEQIKAFVSALEPKDVASRLKLAAWLKEIGREEEAHELAGQILQWEPESAEAHTLLGHLRHRGRWVTPDEAKRAEGYEKHGEKWYTPEEWQNLANADKEAAAAAEEAAAEKRLQQEVNKAVRLALSPDPAVRARGRARLEALAEEFDSARIQKLLAGLDKYIETVDELRRQAAGAAAALSATDGGMVMGEIRATLSKLKRPIRVFQTNLASGPIGANAPVSIMLPELEVIKVRTTMAMPAGVK